MPLSASLAHVAQECAAAAQALNTGYLGGANLTEAFR